MMKVEKKYGGLCLDYHLSVFLFKPSCYNSYSLMKLPNTSCSMEGKTKHENLSESFTMKNSLRKCWKKSTLTWEEPAHKPKGKILNQSLLIKTMSDPLNKRSLWYQKMGKIAKSPFSLPCIWRFYNKWWVSMLSSHTVGKLLVQPSRLSSRFSPC
jgi:hypothetical protein